MSEYTTSRTNQEQAGDPEAYQEAPDVRAKLVELMGRGEPFVVQPDGLFLSMPGKTYSGTTFIDKGCRGGWDHHYEATLNKPTEISRITRAYDRLQVRLSGGGRAALSLEELNEADFLVDQARWQAEAPDSKLNDAVHDWLKSESYISLTFDNINNTLSDWQNAIYVKSRQPLDNPVGYFSRGDSYDKLQPLNGYFERVDSYLDTETNTVMAQVIVSESERSLETAATPWVPLDHLHFFEEELSRPKAYQLRIGQLAAALCEGETDVNTINQFLRDAPSVYLHNYRAPHNQTQFDRIVVGRASDDATIENITAEKIVKPEYFHRIKLDAERIIHDHNHPWVVSQSGLSLPLQRSGQFELADRTSLIPSNELESLIKQAESLAESSHQ